MTNINPQSESYLCPLSPHQLQQRHRRLQSLSPGRQPGRFRERPLVCLWKSKYLLPGQYGVRLGVKRVG